MCCCFFYPKDFSFICSGELKAFQEKLAWFEQRDTVLIACSTDTVEAHLAWLHTPPEKGGIAGVTFPIIADSSKIISMNYEVLAGEYMLTNDSRKWIFSGVPFAYRATFFIDRKGVVRHQSVNDFRLARNIDEYISLVDSLEEPARIDKIYTDQSGEPLQPDTEKEKKSFSKN